jgi:hypothetical protein
MKRFDSIYEAVRHIKRNLPEDTHDAIFLMFHEDKDRFYVADDTTDLENQIEEDFHLWGYESGDPEKHAESYKVWSYVLSENKERYPALYAGHKRTPLSKSHLRGEINVSGEIVASFSVSQW